MDPAGDQLFESRLGILPNTPEAVALRELMSIAVGIVAADEGSLLLMEPDGQNLRFAMTVPSGESERKLRGQTVPVGTGVTGLAAITRHVHVGAPVYRDIAQTDRLSDGPDAVIAAPMLIGDEVLGVITAVTFTQGRLFDARETDLYCRFAGVAALLVQQSQLLNVRKEATAPPAGLSEAAALEFEILERLRTMVARKPSVLAPLARIIGEIEALAGG